MPNRMFSSVLPYFCSGPVCRGFGRGSKDLGCPTANFDYRVIEALPSELDCGIYYGFASVEGFEGVHKAVLSIGWNPYYKNDKKSVETHILHDFGTDFYGRAMKLVMLGHIRPERDFPSLEALIEEIQNDIRVAGEKLDLGEFQSFRTHPFFTEDGKGNS
ncbi:hypothetical protein JTE90_014887 [Oedothorax gibbosus]|uniref:riboflavin kinase n=1 Tax=Oedothorax gibbosus TaxID=931172 RepID=A0AAV6TXH1_9ARAC|nr:hypothetical protein JTE90_014887 [Oedothorax gibbosus]